jgi:hypothetical protein
LVLSYLNRPSRDSTGTVHHQAATTSSPLSRRTSRARKALPLEPPTRIMSKYTIKRRQRKKAGLIQASIILLALLIISNLGAERFSLAVEQARA